MMRVAIDYDNHPINGSGLWFVIDGRGSSFYNDGTLYYDDDQNPSELIEVEYL